MVPQNRDNSRISRRTLLEALAATGIAGSVAGCTGGGGGGGGDGGDGDGAGSDGADGGDGTGGDGGDGGSAETEMGPVNWRGAFTDGGVLSVYGNQLARVMDEHSDHISIQVDGYSGSEENLRILGRGRADLAATNSIVANAAYHDTSPVAGLDFTGDRSLGRKFSMTNWLSDLRTVFVTMADSDVETLSDLKGKKVAMGRGTFFFLPLLDITVGAENVEPVEQPYEGMATALRQGQVAAAPLFGFLGSVIPPFSKDMGTLDLNIIEFTEGELDAYRETGLIRVEPFPLSNVGIDHEPDEIPVPAADYLTVVAPDTSEQAVHEYTRTVTENADQIAKSHAAFGQFSPENLAGNLPEVIPVHPGAASYYQENDLWNDDLSVSTS